MKNRSMKMQPLFFSLLFALLYFKANAQNYKCQNIYIWEFIDENNQKNHYTKDLTNAVEEAFVNIDECLVLQRRKFSSLHAQVQNESNVQSVRDINKNIMQSLSTNGAELVIFGTLNSHGKYELQLRIENLSTTKILGMKSVDLKIEDLINTAKKKKIVSDLVKELVATSKIDKSILTVGSEAWKYFQTAYFEDFTNWQGRPEFKGEIWNKKDDPNTHSCKIDDGRYWISIKKQGYIKHKYIEDQKIGDSGNYNYAHPVSVTIHINETTSCLATNNCLGRGISVRFDKEKKSGFAFTLTDDGDLKFLKFNDLFQQNDMTPLFSKTIKVIKGKDYELGVIAVENDFYLYVDKKFEKMITDSSLPIGVNGVIAIGKGIHWFDNFSIYQPIEVKK